MFQQKQVTIVQNRKESNIEQQVKPMLAAERQRQILNRVLQGGSVRVVNLAKEFSVTEETIRRDLERLGAGGQLIRTHGGAVPVASDRSDLPFGIRENVHLEQKRAIARAAAKHVNEGDVIALDASSTAYELARALPEYSLTVVTNSLSVATVLADRTGVRVIGTGGVLDTPSLSFVGSLAEESLGRFHIRKLFFSCQGLDVENGLTVTEDDHARIKRRMLDLADSAYLLVDSSKFGVKALQFFARVTETDVLITDPGAPQEAIQKIREGGVRVETAI